MPFFFRKNQLGSLFGYILLICFFGVVIAIASFFIIENTFGTDHDRVILLRLCYRALAMTELSCGVTGHGRGIL